VVRDCATNETRLEALSGLGYPRTPARRLIGNLRSVEIEEALELAHSWLRSQSWWSDDEHAISSVTRADGTWVVLHTSREFVETGNELATWIGGYGPVGVTDDGGIIPAEPCCGDWPNDVRTAGERLERAVRLAGLDPAELQWNRDD